MIKHLKHKSIDKLKWDACISSSHNRLIYALSWYLDCVCPNWEALILDDYKAVMPICRKKKFGIDYAYQAAFTQQLGIFSPREITADLSKSFIEKLPIKYFDINLNAANPIDNLQNASISNYTNYILPLNKDYQELYAAYSDNHKRNIKKAKKAQLKLLTNVHENIIVELFRNNKGTELQNFSLDFYEKIYTLIQEAKNQELIDIYSIVYQDKIIAGAFFLRKFDRNIFIFSGKSKEASKHGAMHFLIDSFIKANANTNQILDFEGSNNIGLARFYEAFGSEKTIYPHLRCNKLPKLIRNIVNIVKANKK